MSCEQSKNMNELRLFASTRYGGEVDVASIWFYLVSMSLPRLFRNPWVTEVSVAKDADSKPSDEDLDQRFMTIAAGVADGGLVMPAPFDVASSAALAVNDEKGKTAEGLFDVTAARDSRFKVLIVEEQGADSRELLNTSCIGQGVLFQLLEDLIDELEARHQQP